MTALRGVNLGGWLVTERWMTPELYDGVTGDGERAIGRQLGAVEADRRIRAHRDSFVGPDDLRWIGDHGYGLVRLPIGYWMVDDPQTPVDEGFVGGIERLDDAFTWAADAGLQVLLDLHGLPGSQNGRDHSGQVGSVGLHRDGNALRAVTVVERLAERYGHHPALAAFELINEPHLLLRSGPLVRYYDAAVRASADRLGPEVKIVVSDGFQARRMARVLGRRRLHDRLVLDIHLYRLFTWWQRRADHAAHLRAVEHGWRRLLTGVSRRIPVLVGEWTAALPERALGPDPEVADRRTREFFAAQQAVFDELAWAHCYWSYRVPGRVGPWSLRDSGLV